MEAKQWSVEMVLSTSSFVYHNDIKTANLGVNACNSTDEVWQEIKLVFVRLIPALLHWPISISDDKMHYSLHHAFDTGSVETKPARSLGLFDVITCP